jgi:predicted amidohydrolase YtcJ
MQFRKSFAVYVIPIILLFYADAMAQDSKDLPPEVLAYPDLIVYNGKVVTMDDKSFGLNTSIGTVGQAMAVREGKILAVGTTGRVLQMAGPKTDKIDLMGRMVMPGIINTHDHIHNDAIDAWIGQHPEAERENMSYYSVPLGRSEAETIQAITFAVKEHVRTTQPGRWALITVGAGENSSKAVIFMASKKVTKQMLDNLAPQHPLMVFAHPSYAVNQAFVKGLAKFYGGTVSEEDAGIDEFGRLRVNASSYRKLLGADMYFRTRVPELANIVEGKILEHAALGVTTYVSHMQGERFMDAFNLMEKQKRLPIRFAYTHWGGLATGYPESASFYRRMGDMAGMGTDFFWQIGMGLGSIDSGLPRICSSMEAAPAQKELEFCQNGPGTRQYDTTKVAIANYLRVNVGHAEGDRGIDFFLDAVDEAMKENPAITVDYLRSKRLTSDHCQFYPRIDQLPRMAKFGMLISCEPRALTGSMEWIGPGMYPPKYAKQIAPIRSAIQAGVMVTMESGASVNEKGESPGYFDAAVSFLTRQNATGIMVSAEESIDRNTLLKLMTTWAARFVLKEDVLGSLERGKWADFIVLNKDFFAGPPQSIAGVYPLLTVVGGKITVLREEFAQELGRKAIGPQVKFVPRMLNIATAQRTEQN